MKVILMAAAFLVVAGTAFAVDSGAVDRHWKLARAYLEKGWREHALAEARVVLELDPGNAGAQALVDSKGMKPAVDVPALRSSAGPSADPVAEAWRAYRESRTADARKLAEMVLAADPSSTDAAQVIRNLDEEVYRPSPLGANDVLKEMFDQGVALGRREEWDAAAEVFQRALATEPSHEQVRAFHDRAARRAEQAKVAAELGRAREARAAGREAEARDALLRVLALEPGNAEAKALLDSLGGTPLPPERQAQVKEHFNRGVEAWGEGKWAVAAREWELVTSLDPGDAEAKRLLRKAQAKLRQEKKGAGKRIADLHDEALKLYQQGKADEARKRYREILDLDPNDVKAKNSLELIDGKEGK